VVISKLHRRKLFLCDFVTNFNISIAKIAKINSTNPAYSLETQKLREIMTALKYTENLIISETPVVILDYF